MVQHAPEYGGDIQTFKLPSLLALVCSYARAVSSVRALEHVATSFWSILKLFLATTATSNGFWHRADRDNSKKDHMNVQNHSVSLLHLIGESGM